ncbi:twin-arginine translocation pathway signal protein [Variovorax sp. J22P240]|nr:twin-arginine translocation pathway signal protein [Variovorax sp. J22P240]
MSGRASDNGHHPQPSSPEEPSMIQRRTFVRLLGSGMVTAAGAGSLALWSLSPEFPAEAVEIWRGPGSEPDVRRRAIAYAATAPNPHNRQPWMVDLRTPDTITLYCDVERLLPQTDPFGRQILIGHGAFLELMVMALAEQNVRAEVTLWPEGELPRTLAQWSRRPIARLRLMPGAQPDPLFAQVLSRHTPKMRFDITRPVTEQTLQQVVAAGAAVDVTSRGTVDMALVQPLRELCLDAARVELLTPATVMESLRLMRVGPDEILQDRDGISINSRAARVFSALGQFDRSRPPAADSPAFKQALQMFDDYSSTAMGFVWLATARNGRTDQVQAGRAYVRQQLQATALGLGVHPMSQALQEFPEMAVPYAAAHRSLLDVAAPRGAEDPTLQMMCRIGYPVASVQATPRRPLVQFIIGGAAA